MKCKRKADRIEKIYMASGSVDMQEINDIKARLSALEAIASANIDNTATGETVVVNGEVYYVLEDGTKVKSQHHYVDLAGNIVRAV